MRGTIAAFLSLPYTTGIGYDAWKQEIVNWISKEDNNPDINKRRPLMYYEVLKNIHGHPIKQNNANLGGEIKEP